MMNSDWREGVTICMALLLMAGWMFWAVVTERVPWWLIGLAAAVLCGVSVRGLARSYPGMF